MKKLFLVLILSFIVPKMTEAVEIKQTPNLQSAIFAGGCFWCVEADFEKLNGVVEAISGYCGGSEVNPTYEQISTGKTGHTESVLILFDPNIISYEQLLEKFWLSIDPTVKDRQFCDVGPQYRTEIFYLDENQRQLAGRSKQKVIAGKVLGDKKIYTAVTPATTFYKAEKYHQDYYKKSPLRYGFYRQSCGRDQRLKELWKLK